MLEENVSWRLLPLTRGALAPEQTQAHTGRHSHMRMDGSAAVGLEGFMLTPASVCVSLWGHQNLPLSQGTGPLLSLPVRVLGCAERLDISMGFNWMPWVRLSHPGSLTMELIAPRANF